MKKLAVLLACSALVVPVLMGLPAVAGQVATEKPIAQETDKAERLRLSKDLHDVRNIRERINALIASVADTLPEADREDFQRYVQLHVNYDDLEKKSIAYAAEVYTAPELKAMIAYFGSPDGQSAEAKSETFSGKISKDIAKEIDAAVLAAKYDGVPEKALPKKLQ